ncbi:transcriptional regulator [Hyphomicrobium nitrativorans NL23]|uniref:Transcriptional regulator n=1 Tax=Hyphomicrobium nitrativorans NL23 TaxID=1029756 RepID=V5SDY4_9HYPH|nr:transcriptional regulator [Hyphomicrobium nitrativorans NL23]
MDRLLLSPNEFAHRNGVSRVQVYRMLNSGEICAFKVGKQTKIPVEVEREWRERLPRYVPRAGCQS